MSCFCFVKYSQRYTHTHSHTHYPFFFKQRIAVQTSPDWFAFLFMFLIFGSCYLALLKLAQLHFKVFALLLDLFLVQVVRKESGKYVPLEERFRPPAPPRRPFLHILLIFPIWHLSSTKSSQSAWLRGTRACLPVWFVIQRSVMLAKWFNSASLGLLSGIGA